MQTFLLTFVLLLLIVTAMAIGYIIKRKSIAGSCGGIASLGIDKVCDCDDPCDRRKAKMAKEAARSERQKKRQEMIDKHRIM